MAATKEVLKKGEAAKAAAEAFLATLEFVAMKDISAEEAFAKYQAWLTLHYPSVDDKAQLVESIDTLTHQLQNYFRPIVILAAARQAALERRMAPKQPEVKS